MQVQRINITIPKDTLKKLRRTIPEGQRSRFITHAIEEKLSEEKSKKISLRESLYSGADLLAAVFPVLQPGLAC